MGRTKSRAPTTSATGNKLSKWKLLADASGERSPLSAFTLIELLLVTVLLGLATGLVVTSTSAVLRGINERPLPEILQRAVREARFAAAYQKVPTYLSFDRETSQFIVADPENEILHTLPTHDRSDDPSLEVQFFLLLPATGASFTGWTTPARRVVSRVVFHPDRSSSPFEAQLKYDEVTTWHRYDPFSDAEFSSD